MSAWKQSRTRRRRAGLHQRCAFCGREIPEGQEVFGFGAKARPGANLEGCRGQMISITVRSLGRTVPAVATGPGSPAARAGDDLYFMTCSETCASDLRAALATDIGEEASSP